MSRGKFGYLSGPDHPLWDDTSQTFTFVPPARASWFIVGGRRTADYRVMEPERMYTYDDELHERRRRLAIIRPPIDFQSERLRRLKDRAKDTRDP